MLTQKAIRTGENGLFVYFLLLAAVPQCVSNLPDGNRISVGESFIIALEMENVFNSFQNSDFGGTVNFADPNPDPERDRSGWTAWTQ